MAFGFAYSTSTCLPPGQFSFPSVISRRRPCVVSPNLNFHKNARSDFAASCSIDGVEWRSSSPASPSSSSSSSDGTISRRESLLHVLSTGILPSGLVCASFEASPAAAVTSVENRPTFYELDGSGGVKALDIREGTGATPQLGDKVAIHYYARLAAKQGWRFDSSYDHKDQSGAPEPYVFVVGDGTVIAGLDTAVRTMKEGGVRRVVIPPSQGYQNTTQGPIPPNFSDRQRLYTTIFNPTRLANGEGSTLGILVFDIELLGIRPA